MAHSYLTLGEGHLLLRDSDIFWMMNLLQRQLLARPEQPDSLKQLIDWWQTDDCKAGPGCIDLRLETYLATADAKNCMLELLDAAQVDLSHCGEVVQASFLNKLVPDMRFDFYDIPVEKMLPVIEKVRDLVSSGGKEGTA